MTSVGAWKVKVEEKEETTSTTFFENRDGEMDLKVDFSTFFGWSSA